MLRAFLLFSVLLAVAASDTTTASAIATTNAPKCPGDTGTNCVDDVKDCDKMFADKANCDLAAFEDVAKKCSKTCGICCQNPKYACEDARNAADSCPRVKNACGTTDPQLRQWMADTCPKTCGLCNVGSCKDVLDDCFKMKLICRDFAAQPVLREQCPKTCDFCSSRGAPNPVPNPVSVPQSGCYDLSSRQVCEGNKAGGFCTNPKWPHVRQRCAATCGACGGASTENGLGGNVGNPNCGDNPSSPCAQFKNKGFCGNTYYTIELRMKTCGRTCGWC